MDESGPTDLESNSSSNLTKKYTLSPGEKQKKKCPYCPFSSYYAASLTVHVRRHTGEKPYQCPYCTKVLRFSDRSNMNSHIRKYHKDPKLLKKNSSFIALSPKTSFISKKPKLLPTQKQNTSHFDYFPLEPQMPVINSIYGGISSSACASTSVDTVETSNTLCSPTNTAKLGMPQNLQGKDVQYINTWEIQPRPNRRKPTIVRKQTPTSLDEDDESILIPRDHDRLMNTADFQDQSSDDENLHGGNEPENNSYENQYGCLSPVENMSNSLQSSKIESFVIPELTQPTALQDLHVCNHCGIYFKNLVLHTLHMGSHGYDDPFKCNVCGVQCQNAIEFHCHFVRGNHNGLL